MLTLGIIGNGFVGKATSLFKCDKINVLVYDIDVEKCEPKGLKLDTLVKRSNFICICVPTPMKSTGECDTSIVEKCINDIRKSDSYDDSNVQTHIIVRSTVPVGFCKSMKVNHMPEFLTEANWEKDFKSCETWVIGSGVNDEEFQMDIYGMIMIAKEHNVIDNCSVELVDTDTSEFVKLGRNCFLITNA